MTEVGEVKMLPTSCIRIQLLKVVVVAVFIANLDIETMFKCTWGNLQYFLFILLVPTFPPCTSEFSSLYKEGAMEEFPY